MMGLGIHVHKNWLYSLTSLVQIVLPFFIWKLEDKWYQIFPRLPENQLSSMERHPAQDMASNDYCAPCISYFHLIPFATVI